MPSLNGFKRTWASGNPLSPVPRISSTLPALCIARMHDTPYPIYPVFAFLGFIVGLIPLRWHLQAWNAGTCVYMLWASLACLVEFVDSIVWHHTTANVAPVWCDICEYLITELSMHTILTSRPLATKFLIGAGIGIPAASLCINRRLYKITSVQTATTTYEEVSTVYLKPYALI